MSASLLKRLLRDRSGALASEFALVLPVFTAIVVSVLQFGWGQHCAGSVRFALEQASRSMILDPTLTDDAVRTLVLSKLNAGTAAETTVTVQRAAGAGGVVATLTGVYVHDIGVPMLAHFPFRYTNTVSTPLPSS